MSARKASLMNPMIAARASYPVFTAAPHSARLSPQPLLRFHPVVDVILDPVLVPPLHRIHLDAVDLHGEVQVVARGQARGSAISHDLAALHAITLLDAQLAQVAIIDCRP